MAKRKASTSLPDLLECVKARDLAGMRSALTRQPEEAKSPRPANAAAGMAWRDGLALLEKHGADFNGIHRGYRPLHVLIQESPHEHDGKPSPQRIACLEWLLENGANPELEGGWPPVRAILTATSTGVAEYVEVLRAANAKVDGFVEAALGDVNKIEKRLNQEPGLAKNRTSPHGTTALHCCAASRLQTGHFAPVARLLLDHGADLHASCRGWNRHIDATYLAVGSGQKETVELFLERGANPDDVLTHAMWQKNPADFGEIALRHGADVNRARYASSCKDGEKPLLNQMIRWGQFPSVFWLLEKGANPNLADPRGWTAVHQAASRGNEKLLRAVLDAGGDSTGKTKEGQTPLDIAQAESLIRILKQFGRQNVKHPGTA
jgi:ankyrin repeat protein